MAALVGGCRSALPTESGDASTGSVDTDTGPTAGETSTETADTETGDASETDLPWPGGDVAFVGGIVVDHGGSRAATVVLEKRAILAVLDPGVAVPAEVAVVDVTGRYITPGLIDPHVHITHAGTPWWVGDVLAYNLRAYLYFGVTSVVDAAGPDPTVVLRDRIAAGEIVGPSIKALGPFLTTAGSHPCEVWNDPDSCDFADLPAEGTAIGLARVAAGVDGLKAALSDVSATDVPNPRLDPDVFAAAAAPVLEAGGLVYVHIYDPTDAIDAILGGAGHLAHPVFSEVVDDGTAAVIAALAVQHTTVGAFSGYLDLLDGTLPFAELEPVTSPAVLTAWAQARDDPAIMGQAWYDGSVAWTAAARGTLEVLDSHGTTLLPASDAGYWFIPHGWGLHREMAELVAMGWSNERVLAAATHDAALATGWLDRGAVEPGLRADLLVVDGDPLADLGVLRAPSLVVLGGARYARADIPALDVLVQPAGAAAGELCIDARDCAAGDCDRIDHRCAADCPVPYDAIGEDCDGSSWCSPVDGVDAATDGVCHTVDQTCGLYDAMPCEPAYYDESCVPADVDTSYCYPSGPRVEGQSCSYVDLDLACASGLFCSWVTWRCFTLCDPALGPHQPVCGPGETCQVQLAGPGVPWFGLCL